jgi:hypothetical protein
MTLYLTAASGYLIVAYFQGNNLTRMQVGVVTTLFIYFALFVTFGTFSFFQNAHYFGATYGLGRSMVWTGSVAGMVQLFGIVAALKFMWDVRHNKSD